jgi:hypothetical protein
LRAEALKNRIHSTPISFGNVGSRFESAVSQG